MDLKGDWDYLQEIAKTRLEHNRTDRHVSDYGTEIELMGAAGELAARRYLGLGTKLSSRWDGGIDLLWRGRRVDVKATILTSKLNFRFLQWPEEKKFKADILFLTAIDLTKMQAVIVGWEWVDTVRDAPINLDRDYPCHEIPIVDLRPAWELFILSDIAK